MKYKLIPFNTVLAAIDVSLVPVTLKVLDKDKWSDPIDLTAKPIREVVATLSGLGTQELILTLGNTELRTFKANATYFKFETVSLSPYLK